jgi:hypothetical protein
MNSIYNFLLQGTPYQEDGFDDIREWSHQKVVNSPFMRKPDFTTNSSLLSPVVKQNKLNRTIIAKD